MACWPVGMFPIFKNSSNSSPPPTSVEDCHSSSNIWPYSHPRARNACARYAKPMPGWGEELAKCPDWLMKHDETLHGSKFVEVVNGIHASLACSYSTFRSSVTFYLHVIFLLSPVEMSIRGLYQFSDSVAYFVVNGQCFVASIHWVVTYSNPAVLKKTKWNSQPLTLPTALRITLEVPTKEQYLCY